MATQIVPFLSEKSTIYRSPRPETITSAPARNFHLRGVFLQRRTITSHSGFSASLLRWLELFSHRIQMAPKSDRNRNIFAAFEAGQSLAQLGDVHCLTQGRVRAVLTAEKHKRTVSPEPFYRIIRAAALAAATEGSCHVSANPSSRQ